MIRQRTTALISTIALIAGCGSQGRAEVTGVVRDARTGRAIAGARVVGQDGSATRTDAHGRFTLSVSRGSGRAIRVSASGRHDASAQVIAGAEGPLEISLLEHEEDAHGERLAAPAAWDQEGAHDPDAVLRWIEDVSAFATTSVLSPAPEVETRSDVPVWGETEQWALGGMEGELGGGCTACHGADGALHAREDAVVGEAPVSGLGSGAVCVGCHQIGARSGGAPRSPTGHVLRPQAEVLLGVLGGETRGGEHAWVADTCNACHLVPAREPDPALLTLGHTFATRFAIGENETELRLDPNACNTCHGPEAPELIGAGDWDDDGVSGPLASEYSRALERARGRLMDRVRDECAAVSLSGGPETTSLPRSIAELEALVARCGLEAEIEDDALDLFAIESDRSRGVHNPSLVFSVLVGIAQ